MNSVERIKYYTEVEQEGSALDLPGTALRSAAAALAGWPRRPTIVFESVAAAYRVELGRVLEDVTFRINAGEKTGVVGRTGSGRPMPMLRCSISLFVLPLIAYSIYCKITTLPFHATFVVQSLQH